MESPCASREKKIIENLTLNDSGIPNQDLWITRRLYCSSVGILKILDHVPLRVFKHTQIIQSRYKNKAGGGGGRSYQSCLRGLKSELEFPIWKCCHFFFFLTYLHLNILETIVFRKSETALFLYYKIPPPFFLKTQANRTKSTSRFPIFIYIRWEWGGIHFLGKEKQTIVDTTNHTSTWRNMYLIISTFFDLLFNKMRNTS